MISLELPGCPPLLLNSRLHWRTLHREKAKWYERVYYHARAIKPPAPWDFAEVRYTRFCGYVEPDHDNLVSGTKWIQDALVKAGLFVDDSPDHLLAKHAWARCAPRFKRVLVEIVPRSSDEDSP